jgi:hypothetical protein
VEGANPVEGIVKRRHREKEPSNGAIAQVIILAKELALVG